MSARMEMKTEALIGLLRDPTFAFYDCAVVYAELINRAQDDGDFDWMAVNSAIIDRGSIGWLERVKRLGWQLYMKQPEQP